MITKRYALPHEGLRSPHRAIPGLPSPITWLDSAKAAHATPFFSGTG